jgi:DNA-binding response OmpR family regulator
MNYDERIRVLYIEDNCDSFEMLKVLLGLSQIDVDSAPSVGDALMRAGSERFDLYLLDSGLARRQWTQSLPHPACRRSREAHSLLFRTRTSEDIKMGMAAGADGYITKPHSDKLAETIIQLVANHREKPFALVSLPVLVGAAAA